MTFSLLKRDRSDRLLLVWDGKLVEATIFARLLSFLLFFFFQIVRPNVSSPPRLSSFKNRVTRETRRCGDFFGGVLKKPLFFFFVSKSHEV